MWHLSLFFHFHHLKVFKWGISEHTRKIQSTINHRNIHRRGYNFPTGFYSPTGYLIQQGCEVTFQVDNTSKPDFTAADACDAIYRREYGTSLYIQHAETCPNVTGRTKERVSQSKRSRTGLLEAVGWPQWRERWDTTYLWRCLFLVVVFCHWFCWSLSLPIGMLPLNSLFPSIYDMAIVLLLSFIVSFRMSFLTLWPRAGSLRSANVIIQSI